MSKGSKRRPRVISRKQYESNWDMVFGKKDKSCGGLPAGFISDEDFEGKKIPGGRKNPKRYSIDETNDVNNEVDYDYIEDCNDKINRYTKSRKKGKKTLKDIVLEGPENERKRSNK